MFNPLHLISNVNVKVRKVTYLDSPATVSKLSQKRYEITINTPWIARNFPPHLHSVVEIGLMLHEVAHIKYNSFGYPVSNRIVNSVATWIDDILEDARVEYHLSSNYPYAAKFFALITAMMPRPKHKYIDSLNEKLEALFNIVRFGIVPDGFNDSDFLSFVIPRVIVSRRGNRKQCLQATLDIYRYLCKHVSHQHDDFMASKFDRVEPILDQKIDGEKVINTQISEVDDIIGMFNAVYHECETKIIERPQPDDFYVSVLEQYRSQIEQLVSVVEQLLESRLNICPSRDGDINISKVQHAYIASLTGDEGKFFNRFVRFRPSADVVIIRDISSSTSHIKTEYAKAVIMICEALSRFKDVNIAVVDFNSNVSIVKQFTDELSLSHIWPRSFGGTALGGTMKVVAKRLPWLQRNRIVFIITDGYPDSWTDVYEALHLDYYKTSKIVPVVITNTGYVAKSMIDVFGMCANVVDVTRLPNELATLFVKFVQGGM